MSYELENNFDGTFMLLDTITMHYLKRRLKLHDVYKYFYKLSYDDAQRYNNQSGNVIVKPRKVSKNWPDEWTLLSTHDSVVEIKRKYITGTPNDYAKDVAEYWQSIANKMFTHKISYSYEVK